MNEYIFKLLNNNNNYFNHSQILATFVRLKPTNFSLNKSIELEKKRQKSISREIEKYMLFVSFWAIRLIWIVNPDCFDSNLKRTFLMHNKCSMADHTAFVMIFF